MAEKEVSILLEQFKRCINSDSPSNAENLRRKMAGAMSRVAGHLRDIEGMKRMADELKGILDGFFSISAVSSCFELPYLMKNRDIFITQLAVLSAMIETAEKIGSRGSALVLSENGEKVSDSLAIKYKPGKCLNENCLVLTAKCPNGFVSRFEPVRPLPKPDNWFENAWNNFRERTKNIYGDDFE